MKILLVHNSYQQPGGEDVAVEQEINLLRRAGHTVTLYQRSNWEISSFSGLKQIALMRNTVWNTESQEHVRKILAREKPDIVHAHNTFVMISPSIFSACRQAGVPVIQTLHNYRMYCPAATFFRDGHVCEECVEHGLSRSIVHKCYRESRAATAGVVLMLTANRWHHAWTQDVDCYIALTRFARSKFIDSGMPPEKIVVKPNFVYPDLNLRADGTGNYALFVGRLSPEKRLDTLLAAWQKLGGRIPLKIVGGGALLEHVRKEILRLGLSNVELLGQLPRDKIMLSMQQARFLILSSECYENFPITLAESFACRLPPICSKVGAMEEIVDDGRTGLHFASGDSSDLASKVAWAWDHPAQMHAMGKEARREYELRYTAEKNYPILMDIYQRVIKQGPRDSTMLTLEQT